MIQARMADGTVLQFPEGTADAVIDKAASDYIGSSKAPAAPSDAAPTSWLPDWLAKGPSWLPDSLSKPPGSTSVLDREPRPSQWPEAAVQAYKDTSILTPEGKEALKQAPPVVRNVVDPLLGVGNTLLGIYNAGGAAIATGVNETAAQLGVPELGRDINMGMQVAPMAHVGTGVPQLPGPRVAPRVHPMMEAFDRMDAARAAPEPPPVPPRAPTPAEAAPGFVPPGSEVPISLRLKAAIEAADTAPPRPGMVPPGEASPPPRVQPGAAGPATVPYNQPEPMLMMDSPPWTPPQGEGAGSRANPMMEGFNRVEPPSATPEVAPPPGTALTIRDPEQPGGSVGAAASREGTPANELGLTPAEVEQYARTAEGQKLTEPQPHGIPDYNNYVEGAEVSAPEMLQTVEAARELKSLIAKDPKLGDLERARLGRNNDTFTNAFDKVAQTPRLHGILREARNTDFENRIGPLWENQKPTSIDPILKEARDILNSPEGQREGVQNVVRDALKGFYRDGEPLTSPELVHGGRMNIIDLMEKRDGGGRVNQRAMSALTRLKDVAANTVENGAPGYKAMNEKFAVDSAKIDALESIYDHRSSLFDGQGRMQYLRFKKMMRQIVDARAADGLQPEKHIPQEFLNDLWAVHDALRRQSAAADLMKSPGSDTVANFFDAARGHLEGTAGKAAATAVGGLFGGPIGMAAGWGAQEFFAGKAAKRRMTRGQEMIAPPQNRLAPPLE